MSEIKISIIVPVFNAEKYIGETLQSISEQSFSEYELILVNDGSKDSSMEIVETFRSKISNMVIINQKNSGVSAARNNAMKVARGAYIGFVDADDILHKDYLKILYETTKKNADIVFCEYDIFYNSDKIQLDNVDCIEPEELCHKYDKKTFDYAMDIGFGTSPCIKIYKTEIIRKYNIIFDEQSSFGEDMFFNWKVFLESSNIYYIHRKLYFYRQSPYSATLKFHPRLFENYMREYDSIRRFCEENGLDETQIKSSINNNLVKRIPSLLRMNIRQKGNIFAKKNRVKELIGKKEIQDAILDYEKSNALSKELFAIKNKKYWKVFYYGCIYEYRFRLARYIKNLIKI